jgi:hypothetical protein
MSLESQGRMHERLLCAKNVRRTVYACHLVMLSRLI